MTIRTKNNIKYKLCKANSFTRDFTAKKSATKNQKSKERDVQFFYSQLRYLVLRQLKPGSKQLKYGKIILTSEVLNELKTKYSINSRFKECNTILIDHEIQNTRIFNEHDFCEIKSFYARIHQPGKLCLSKNEITSAPYFSFKYLKANEVL